MDFLITFLIIFAIVFVVAVPFLIIIYICLLFSAWLDSRETHIEPIVSEGAQK